MMNINIAAYSNFGEKRKEGEGEEGSDVLVDFGIFLMNMSRNHLLIFSQNTIYALLLRKIFFSSSNLI